MLFLGISIAPGSGYGIYIKREKNGGHEPNQGTLYAYVKMSQ
jgi:hypothetical protein